MSFLSLLIVSVSLTCPLHLLHPGIRTQGLCSVHLATDSRPLLALCREILFLYPRGRWPLCLQLAHLSGFDDTKLTSSLLTEAGSKLGLAPEEHGTLAPLTSSATSANARPIGLTELQSQGMLAVAIHVTLGMLTPSKSSQEEKNNHTSRPCRGFKGDLQLPRATGLLTSERGLWWKETR